MAVQFAQTLLQGSSWMNGQIPLSAINDTNPFEFDWDNVHHVYNDQRWRPANRFQATPHNHFEWHDCYDEFKCARLQVPMDWLGTSDERDKTVEIAVIKLEATVPVTDEAYGGIVVLNPGGPGVSGIPQVLKGGHHVRTILSAGPDADRDTAKHFDIVGFDPRGVNNTRPMLACFPNQYESALWRTELEADGFMKSSNIAFDNLWARHRAIAEGCSKRAAAEGIAKHMSTAPVARDIIEIFERHGQWRESEATRLLDTELKSITSEDERSKIVRRTAFVPGEEMVQYWGFSYGSILGGTMSATYPTRIKRAVLDGVVHAHDYMRGGWSTNLRDTDLIFLKFAEYCHEAGPENCAFYDPDGPAVITDNAQKIISKLASNPISIPGNATHGPQVITLTDLKLLIRYIVYNPMQHFVLTAQVFHELSKGEAPALADWRRHGRPQFGERTSAQCESDGPYSPSCFATQRPWDALSGIECSDGLPRLDQSKEDFRAYADSIMAQSWLIGEYWATFQLPCTAWHARPHWRYEGDFNTSTAHPILLVGNTFDPVTPLYNAFHMAKSYDSCGILHQDSEGHCSYSAPSMCTGKALREYFQTGKLPGSKGRLDDWDGYGALCEPDRRPFDSHSGDDIPPLPSGESDEALWEALVKLGSAWS